MLFLYFWTLSMLKLPTECMLVSKELKVISHFISMFRSYLHSYLFHRFCSKLLHITCWARFHWVSEQRQQLCGNAGRGGKANLGSPPQSLYALTSFSSSRNTATKAALYLSKNNRSNFGKYTLSVRNRLVHIKQKYCHFGTVT